MRVVGPGLRGAATGGLLLALLWTGGCTGFRHAWNEAAASTSPAGSLEGRWQGSWQSEVTGHTDQLRCIVTHTPAGGLQARFQAKYRKLVRLSFSYTVPLTVTETNGTAQFRGEADLGWLAGGVYHYEGHADNTNFLANYGCPADHGTFRMSRP